MNLSGARDNYYTFSASLSSGTRQLAFAGIAVVWIFAQQDGDIVSTNELLRKSMLCFVFSLAFDLFQYFYASAAWGIFHRIKEEKLNHDDSTEFTAPYLINWPTNFFFWGKAVIVLVGFFQLISFLMSEYYLIN
ncbi:conserved membrane protein of unknown function [Shewanella benthica]|uniref:Uncharacterized protein n=1 Tax=Shewanella benthica TaxID=43661 RepID=A0A330M851_9GAMM|nr:hypothetical protein [Shewanella benthica]SQH78338.1 conserved membrane protein of unknown function [Shewanella benthica]